MYVHHKYALLHFYSYKILTLYYKFGSTIKGSGFIFIFIAAVPVFHCLQIFFFLCL